MIAVRQSITHCGVRRFLGRIYLDLLNFLIKEDSRVQEKELMSDICPVRHAAVPAIVTVARNHHKRLGPKHDAYAQLVRSSLC